VTPHSFESSNETLARPVMAPIIAVLLGHFIGRAALEMHLRDGIREELERLGMCCDNWISYYIYKRAGEPIILNEKAIRI